MDLWIVTPFFSSALTKVLPKHDVRLGADVVHHRLNHRQAEFGTYGLKGGFGFSHNTTGASGYISPGCNDFATKPIDRGTLLGILHKWLPSEALARQVLTTAG